MKEKPIIAIIFLLLSLFTSCEKISPNENNAFKGKGSSLIEKEETSNHFYELSEIKTKIDVITGEKKCKNYGVGKIAPDELYIYGLGLKYSLSVLLGIPEKDIIYENPEFRNYCFELNYKMKNNLNFIVKKDTIINKLLSHYKLSLVTDSINIEAYRLKILDSIKLKNSISKNKDGKSSSRVTKFEAEINGISLNNFANIMNMKNPNYHFFSKIDTKPFYDFKIKLKSNIKFLNKDLEEKYGLIFVKDSMKIKRVKIKTAANTVYN